MTVKNQKNGVLQAREAFTLLEMVIALTVFMILMGGVFQAVLMGMRAQEVLRLEREALIETRLWAQDFQASLRGASLGSLKTAEQEGDILADSRAGLAQDLDSMQADTLGQIFVWQDASGLEQKLRWQASTGQLFWNESPLYAEALQVTLFDYEVAGSLVRWSIQIQSKERLLLDYQNAQVL